MYFFPTVLHRMEMQKKLEHFNIEYGNNSQVYNCVINRLGTRPRNLYEVVSAYEECINNKNKK